VNAKQIMPFLPVLPPRSRTPPTTIWISARASHARMTPASAMPGVTPTSYRASPRLNSSSTTSQTSLIMSDLYISTWRQGTMILCTSPET
jgi:hypothetical protein